jgi:hypothetical protein
MLAPFAMYKKLVCLVGYHGMSFSFVIAIDLLKLFLFENLLFKHGCILKIADACINTTSLGLLAVKLPESEENRTPPPPTPRFTT